MLSLRTIKQNQVFALENSSVCYKSFQNQISYHSRMSPPFFSSLITAPLHLFRYWKAVTLISLFLILLHSSQSRPFKLIQEPIDCFLAIRLERNYCVFLQNKRSNCNSVTLFSSLRFWFDFVIPVCRSVFFVWSIVCIFFRDSESSHASLAFLHTHTLLFFFPHEAIHNPFPIAHVSSCLSEYHKSISARLFNA